MIECLTDFTENNMASTCGPCPVNSPTCDPNVPTCNPNKEFHGQGHFARLTGANAEVLDMFFIMFLGEKAFSYENGTLKFTPSPKLSK